MSRKSLAQQAQNLDARHAAHQARTAQPLTARQAAQKSIASIKQNNQGTPAKTLPLTKTSKLDKGLKR